MRLFELKVNGLISPEEEWRRKELIIDHVRRDSMTSASNRDDDSDDDDGAGIRGCIDGLLRYFYVCLKLIDDPNSPGHEDED